MNEIERKNIALKIIETYYSENHDFIYNELYYGYDRCCIVSHQCSKCKYELQVIFWEEDDWKNEDNQRFYEETYFTDPNLECTRLNYFGTSRLLNNDNVDIISCNEWLIKTLLE